MPKLAAVTVFIALTARSFSAPAQWLQPCEGPDGEVTYSSTNCPAGHTPGAPQRLPPASPTVKQSTQMNNRKSNAAIERSTRRTSAKKVPASKAPEKKALEERPAPQKKSSGKEKRKKYVPNQP